MRKTFASTSSTALLAAGLITAGVIGVAAQAPSAPAPAPATQSQSPAAGATAEQRPAADAVLKLTGCLKEEKDVAGLKPNLVERAGITEDYILTAVKAAPDSQVSGLAVGTMYEVEGIAESELKKHLNHQVEISGRVAASATGARNRDDVPDFQATSLRMLAATCPAK